MLPQVRISIASLEKIMLILETSITTLLFITTILLIYQLYEVLKHNIYNMLLLVALSSIFTAIYFVFFTYIYDKYKWLKKHSR